MTVILDAACMIHSSKDSWQLLRECILSFTTPTLLLKFRIFWRHCCRNAALNNSKIKNTAKTHNVCVFHQICCLCQVYEYYNIWSLSLCCFFKYFNSCQKGDHKERDEKEEEETFLSERRGETLSISLFGFLLKTDGIFAKTAPKLYIFNILWKTRNYNRGHWGEKGRERVLIAASSININQSLSTFHTSTVALRGPRVHLAWPLIAISPSNDAFS